MISAIVKRDAITALSQRITDWNISIMSLINKQSRPNVYASIYLACGCSSCNSKTQQNHNVNQSNKATATNEVKT